MAKKDKAKNKNKIKDNVSDIYDSVPIEGSETDTSFAPFPGDPSSSAKKKKEKKPKKEKSKKEIEVTRKPSPVVAPLPELSEEEFFFFEQVRSGDIAAVVEFIESNSFSDLNINKINKEGYTVLHLAVQKKDVEMTELLLTIPGIELYDTVLHAIKAQSVELVKILLEVDDRITSAEQRDQLINSLNRQESLGVLAPPPTLTMTSPISSRSGILSSIRPTAKRTGSGTQVGSGTKMAKKKKSKDDVDVERRSSTRRLSLGIETGTAAERRRRRSHEIEEEEEEEVEVVSEDVVDKDDIPFDSEFHPVITPLMLAAQEGCTELIQLFYERNERLETSEFRHNSDCNCDICLKLEGDQDMSRAYQRYNLFKAISVPEYICFVAMREKVDPVNYCIDKIVRLRDIIEKDIILGELYEPFLESLEDFMIALLESCRTTVETQIFMSMKDTQNKERLPHQYPRLWYAVGLKLQKLVVHPSSQNLVYKMWATDLWPEWDTFGTFQRCFHIAIRIIFWLFIGPVLFCAQDSSYGRTLGSPVSRFLTYLGSYIFFLAILAFQVLWPYQRCNDPSTMRFFTVDDDQCKERGPPFMGSEFVLIPFVVSFAVATLKRQGVAWYWKHKWNWIELAGILFFGATYFCWLMAYLWKQKPENEPFIYATERIMWPHDCWEILGECFLALATIVSFGRLFRFTAVLPVIGPLQVAMGKAIIDYICVGGIFYLMLSSFVAGLMVLYVPYKDYVGLNGDGKMVTQDDGFTSFSSAMLSMWGYVGGGAGQIEIVAYKENFNDTNSETIHHKYNQLGGKILYYVFEFFAMAMLWDVVKGYWGATFSKTTRDMDTVWKFSRTELYMTFIKDAMMPPPCAWIPTIKTCATAVQYCKLVGKKTDPRADCSLLQCCFITESSKKRKWKRLRDQYRKLVIQLIYRYQNSKQQEDGNASKEELDELADELAEIKTFLKGNRKSSKDKIESSSSDDDSPPPAGGGGAASGWAKPKLVADSVGVIHSWKKSKQSGGNQGGGEGGGGGASTSSPVIRSQPTGGSPLQVMPAPTQVSPAGGGEAAAASGSTRPRVIVDMDGANYSWNRANQSGGNQGGGGGRASTSPPVITSQPTERSPPQSMHSPIHVSPATALATNVVATPPRKSGVAGVDERVPSPTKTAVTTPGVPAAAPPPPPPPPPAPGAKRKSTLPTAKDSPPQRALPPLPATQKLDLNQNVEGGRKSTQPTAKDSPAQNPLRSSAKSPDFNQNKEGGRKSTLPTAKDSPKPGPSPKLPSTNQNLEGGGRKSSQPAAKGSLKQGSSPNLSAKKLDLNPNMEGAAGGSRRPTVTAPTLPKPIAMQHPTDSESSPPASLGLKESPSAISPLRHGFHLEAGGE